MEQISLQHIFKRKLGNAIEGIVLFTDNGYVRPTKLDKLKI